MKHIIIKILSRKLLWMRIITTILILGAISCIIISDWEVQCGTYKCGTKSNINVDIKR